MSTRVPKAWQPEIDAACERRKIKPAELLKRSLRRVLDGETNLPVRDAVGRTVGVRPSEVTPRPKGAKG